MDSLILLLLLVPLLLIAFRGSKQRKAVAQMQAEIGPGREVMTASGQFGVVTQVTDDRVEIEVAPGVRTWWLRQAIARTVEPVADPDDAEVADEHVVTDERPDGTPRSS